MSLAAPLLRDKLRRRMRAVGKELKYDLIETALQ